MFAECLSNEAQRFLPKVGPHPRTWIHSTRCIRGSGKRHIIVMHVPSLSNDEEFQHLLQTSCKAAMQSAISENPQTDVALPLKLGDHLPLKTCVMPMLMAVVESVQENQRPDDAVHVKLYLDKPFPDTSELLDKMENRLLLCGWSLDAFFGEFCFCFFVLASVVLVRLVSVKNVSILHTLEVKAKCTGFTKQ